MQFTRHSLRLFIYQVQKSHRCFQPQPPLHLARSLQLHQVRRCPVHSHLLLLPQLPASTWAQITKVKKIIRPFANLESLAAWTLYHSNFVNRKRLPQFHFQQMHGLPQWLKLSKIQQEEQSAELRSVINNINKFFPLLEPWEYVDRHSGRIWAGQVVGWDGMGSVFGDFSLF